MSAPNDDAVQVGPMQPSPSKAAIRAATALRNLPTSYADTLLALFDPKEEDRRECEEIIVGKTAEIIDRETCLPDLMLACEATLLFHSGSPWVADKAARWMEITSALLGPPKMAHEATTRVLCDLQRAALAKSKGEQL